MLKFEPEEFFWIAKTRLPEWAGFQERFGAYGAKNSVSPSDGTLSIIFAPEARETDPLKDEELKLVDWFLYNHVEQARAVMKAIMFHYPSIRDSYLEAYDDEDVSEILPEVSSADELKSLIGLSNINIHQISKNGIPYVGYEFGCNWDEEHGLGVLMHENRLVEIGYADAAFLLWIAEKDAEEDQ